MWRSDLKKAFPIQEKQALWIFQAQCHSKKWSLSINKEKNEGSEDLHWRTKRKLQLNWIYA